MNSPATTRVDFWRGRLEVNARQAIFHQWEQLEASGCIENFRIAAGEVEGFRAGWFFADSDAYKWLEAAARIWASQPDTRLGALMDDFIGLLARAQAPDGYLFTYNQIHFPGQRWQNLQIEHELYCLGHLIEAGVSHFLGTRRADLLAIARRAADRVVADFWDKGPAYTCGHEEIEIALLRLHQVVPGDSAYLEMARQFIERRGRSHFMALEMVRQFISMGQRGKYVAQQKQAYLAAHPGYQPFELPPENPTKEPSHTLLRWYASALSGKYAQQHAPVRRQTVPVGHAVRFAYLETAVALLARLSGDRSLLPALEQAWERMVTRRMSLTGGIGALPGLEGFGNDDELDPETAYNETCAALGCLFWNWEMAQLTGQAKYSDLFEWQLYNAAAVGMGLDGKSYLYNNPLASRAGITRRPWYAVPCCPSNLSRTWADLERYRYTSELGILTVHQYISGAHSTQTIPLAGGGSATIGLEMETGLPWEGRARLRVSEVSQPTAGAAGEVELRLRLPGWAARMAATLNGEVVAAFEGTSADEASLTAAGYDPRGAVFQPVRHAWAAGDTLEFRFAMPVRVRRPRAGVKGMQGKVALTRGPLVYCLENLDNPGVDIFTARLDLQLPDPQALTVEWDASLLGGMVKIVGRTMDGSPLTFIPYFLWGNRGPSQMTVWVNA